MAYISNPVYCGVGAVDKAEESVLTRNAQFTDAFTAAYKLVNNMSTADKQSLLLRVRGILNSLPYDVMEQHIDTALEAAKVLDPRRAPGLGQAGAIGTVAQVASIIASLTATTAGVYNFIQGRKTSKEQKAAFDAQQALVKQQMQAQIDAEKKQNDAQAQVTAAQTQAAVLSAQGLTTDAQGNVVKKSSTGTIAAIVAAGAGAFFLAK